VTDSSLSEEIPTDLAVFKTPATDYFSIYKKDRARIPSAGFAGNPDNSVKGKILRFIRGNFFIPDPRRGWNTYAFTKACRLIEEMGIQHVVTTSPPHSTQLIGLKLKSKFPSIKWLSDLRDPWTDIYYYKQFYPTLVSKAIDSRYEKKVLKNADRITVVGESLKEVFSSKIKSAGEKIYVITNGYDENDFIGRNPEDPSVFTITYVGTLSDVYPLKGFLSALELFRSKGNKFILRFIGIVSVKQKELIRSKLDDSELQFIPYVNHAESIKYMRGSSALLLIIPDHRSNKSIITGKIFEYIASCRPVICIGPGDGDAAGIIRLTGSGKIFSYTERESICSYLNEIHKKPFQFDPDKITMFSRNKLTGQIVEILD
jgi:glycosyltransferase involved in cell wall biosynthesis